eukprot:COSAG01_NODE_2804_length_7046_cov_1030.843242_5_plen_105_part_00
MLCRKRNHGISPCVGSAAAVRSASTVQAQNKCQLCRAACTWLCTRTQTRTRARTYTWTYTRTRTCIHAWYQTIQRGQSAATYPRARLRGVSLLVNSVCRTSANR